MRQVDNAPFQQSPSADSFLQTMLRLMEREDYTKISVAELCREARLSRKTFYKYFSNTRDLLDYLVESICVQFSQEDDRSGTLFYFRFWYERKDLIHTLVHSRLWDVIHTAFIDQYMPLLQPRIWEKYFDETPYAKEISAAVLSGALTRIIRWWHDRGYPLRPEQMAQITDRILADTVDHLWTVLP